MKKFLLYSGVGIAIFWGLFLAVNYWLVQSTTTRVEALREEIAAAGDYVYLRDYPIKSIPDEENAYHALRLAKADLDAFLEDDAAHFDPERQLRPEEVEALTDWIEKNSALFERLEQAAGCPDFQAPVDYSDALLVDIDHVHLFRAASRAWSCKAVALAHQGKGDEALEQCEVVLQFASHLREDPILVSHLTNMACQALAASTANHVLRVAETTPEGRAKFVRALNRLDNYAASTLALKGERAGGIQTFREYREGILARSRFVGKWAGQVYVNDDEAKYIESLNQIIELVPNSRQQRAIQIKSLEQALQEGNGPRYPATKMLVPAFAAFFNAVDGKEASIRSLRVLLAVEGQPETTMEAVNLPKSDRRDPYSRKLLRLRYQDGEPTVYSVGKNEIDDGGAVFNPDDMPLDIGFGPLHEPAPIKKQEEATAE